MYIWHVLLNTSQQARVVKTKELVALKIIKIEPGLKEMMSSLLYCSPVYSLSPFSLLSPSLLPPFPLPPFPSLLSPSLLSPSPSPSPLHPSIPPSRRGFQHHPAGDTNSLRLQTPQHSGLPWQLPQVRLSIPLHLCVIFSSSAGFLAWHLVPIDSFETLFHNASLTVYYGNNFCCANSIILSFVWPTCTMYIRMQRFESQGRNTKKYELPCVGFEPTGISFLGWMFHQLS